MKETCPECGAEPTDESIKQAKLFNLGYELDKDEYECSECGNKWPIR